MYASGGKLKLDGDWTITNGKEEKLDIVWTGRTIFIVDRVHSPLYGTDQWQQQSEATNQNQVSWASAFD